MQRLGLLLDGDLVRGHGGDGAELGKSEADADLVLDVVAQLGVLAQELLGGLAALAEPLLAVRVPGAGLADDALLDAQVEDAALLADARCRT